MCQGGIYDHLGGGLLRAMPRTSEWLIPHFEKMLYGQCPADRPADPGLGRTMKKARLYATRHRRGTCDWVLREMVAEGRRGLPPPTTPTSEGVEGKFYVWNSAEIDAVLGAEDAGFFNGVLRRAGRWQLGERP